MSNHTHEEINHFISEQSEIFKKSNDFFFYPHNSLQPQVTAIQITIPVSTLI